MVLHHHEKYEGSEYPSGIIGKAIPLESRIICVAVDELIKYKGIQFDPKIVDAFLKIDFEE